MCFSSAEIYMHMKAFLPLNPTCVGSAEHCVNQVGLLRDGKYQTCLFAYAQTKTNAI